MLGLNASKIHRSAFIPLPVLKFDLKDNILKRFDSHSIRISSPDLESP